MLLLEGEVVPRGVVCRQDEDVAVLAHALVQIAEEVGQVAVQTQVGVLRLDGEGAVVVPYVVGGGVAHREEVCLLRTAAQLLALDGSLGHLEGQRIAKGRGTDDALAELLQQPCRGQR